MMEITKASWNTISGLVDLLVQNPSIDKLETELLSLDSLPAGRAVVYKLKDAGNTIRIDLKAK